VGLAALAVSLMTVAAPSAARQAIVKFKTPRFPTAVVSAYGSIWVSTHRDVVLYRINPKANRIVARINLGADTCWLGASGRRVWASGCEGDNTTRVIDPRKNKIVGRVQGFGAIVGGGSLWLVRDPSSGILARLDPKTHVLLKTFRVSTTPDMPPILAGYAFGSVWIGGPDTVRRIDGGTNTLTVIPLPAAKTKPSPNQGYAGGGPMAFAGGKAWIGNPAGIYEIDPGKNTATLRPIRVGNLDQWGNIEMTSGLGSVWARTSGTRASRIDPATGKLVGRYPAAGGGGGVAASYGSLWVTNAGLDSVWREPVKSRRGPITRSNFTSYHAKVFKPAFTVRLPAGWTVAERDAAGAQIWRKCRKCAHEGEENGEITLDMALGGMSPSDAIARLQKAHNIDAGPSRMAQLGTLSGFEFTATRTGKGDVLFEDGGYGSEAVGAPLDVYAFTAARRTVTIFIDPHTSHGGAALAFTKSALAIAKTIRFASAGQ